MIGIFCILFAVISALIVQELPQHASPVAKTITFLIMEVVSFLLFAGIMAVVVVLSMVSGHNKTVLTEHTIILTDDSLVEETAYCKTEQKWLGVQKLARTKGYLFIYIMQHGAHVIPRRAFRDDTEWNAFYEFCRQKSKPA